MLSKFFISDFSRIRVGVHGYQHMVDNCRSLCEKGAVVDGDGLPFDNITGFPIRLPLGSWEVPLHEADPELLKHPGDLLLHKELRLLVWGAPHCNPSSGSGLMHGSSAETSAEWKTDAFESMAWLCPKGTVIMTFPPKYRVEFSQPAQFHPAHPRQLVVGRMFSRGYVPLDFTIDDTSTKDVMIALLVPENKLWCLKYTQGKIDFGLTVLNILKAMSGGQFGCALGVHDASLEMELLRVDPRDIP